ncbi:unnamed protein product [Adineta steineri]|uniref:Uncharacterized protein n=1 Tax=Adineta steineri TaxID=433720 RepID=A0A818UTL6_9BILA|nr:unnamed protein product [Adineta steineri]CAF3702631.1 unnamed protein product [Adineta steineri]
MVFLDSVGLIFDIQMKKKLVSYLHGYSCVAYNDWKNPIVISSIEHNFIVHACEIMSVNHIENTFELNIIARKNKIPIYLKTITLKRDNSKIIEFDSWIDINELEFSIIETYFILTWIQLK